MSKHISFAAYGHQLLSYGRKWETRDPISSGEMPHEVQMKCVLLAILDVVRDVHSELVSTRLLRETQEEQHASDGMIAAMRLLRTDVESVASLLERQVHPLSVRARHALRLANFHGLAEITEERLMSLRNVGVVTCREIMEWKRKCEAGSDLPASNGGDA